MIATIGRGTMAGAAVYVDSTLIGYIVDEISSTDSCVTPGTVDYDHFMPRAYIEKIQEILATPWPKGRDDWRRFLGDCFNERRPARRPWYRKRTRRLTPPGRAPPGETGASHSRGLNDNGGENEKGDYSIMRALPGA